MALDVSLKLQTQQPGNTQSSDSPTSATTMNSVMSEANVNIGNVPTNGCNEAETSNKIDTLLIKLCSEINISGITPDKIKQSGIIYRISGMNASEFENAKEEEQKKIMDCLKAAIQDSIVNGQVDLEKAGEKGNKYYIALLTGWDSIEQYKKNQKGESLSLRMERFFGLDKKGVKFTDLTQVQIEDYLQRYFNQYFTEKLKNASKEEKVKIYRQQLRDFGKLLNNTPDSEKAVFKQAISSLFASNRLPGMEAVLKSFDTPAASTEWANSWSTDEINNVLTGSDVEGNVMSKKDATAFVAGITKFSSQDVIETRHIQHNDEAKKFFAEHKDALEIIAQKMERQEALTPEEQQLKLQLENYFTSFNAGEMTGTALNNMLEQEAKEKLLDTMNRDAYELPNYKDVLEQVSEYVKNLPEVLNEDVKTILDKATNGNYSRIADNTGESLSAPPQIASTKDASAYTEADILTKRANIELIRQDISANSGDTAPVFTVESNYIERNYVTRERNSLKAKLANKSPKEKLDYIIKNIGNLSFGERWAVCDGFKQLGHKKLMDVLSKIHSDSFILRIYKQVGLTTEDIENLNVSITAKNLMLNELRQEGKAENELA